MQFFVEYKGDRVSLPTGWVASCGDEREFARSVPDSYMARLVLDVLYGLADAPRIVRLHTLGTLQISHTSSFSLFASYALRLDPMPSNPTPLCRILIVDDQEAFRRILSTLVV